MPTSSPPLVALSDVKAYLAIDPSVMKYDTLLATLIEEWSQLFEAECGQPVARTEILYHWAGTGRSSATLPFRPLQAVTCLDELPAGRSEWMEIPTGRYRLVGEMLVADNPLDRTTCYRARIEVGYAPEDIPRAISMAVRARVIIDVLDSPVYRNRLGLKSEVEAGGTDAERTVVTYDRSKAEAEWARLVRRYRRLP